MMMMTMMAKKTKMGFYDDLIACPELAAPPPGTHVPCPTLNIMGALSNRTICKYCSAWIFICCPFIKHQAKLRLLLHSVPFLYHVSNSKQVRSVIIWGSTSFGRFQESQNLQGTYRTFTGLFARSCRFSDFLQFDDDDVRGVHLEVAPSQ